MGQVPEEAVKAAFEATGGSPLIRQILDAGAPAIRNKERQRIQEALKLAGSLVEEVLEILDRELKEEGTEEFDEGDERCISYNLAFELREQLAALGTLDPSGEAAQ